MKSVALGHAKSAWSVRQAMALGTKQLPSQFSSIQDPDQQAIAHHITHLTHKHKRKDEKSLYEKKKGKEQKKSPSIRIII